MIIQKMVILMLGGYIYFIYGMEYLEIFLPLEELTLKYDDECIFLHKMSIDL